MPMSRSDHETFAPTYLLVPPTLGDKPSSTMYEAAPPRTEKDSLAPRPQRESFLLVLMRVLGVWTT